MNKRSARSEVAMHVFPWMWVFFGMFFWLCFIRPRRLRVCESAWPSGEARRPADRPGRGGRRVDLEVALAERDVLIAKLEERVRVLERIATDGSARLRDEIDRLRDMP
jgi:hypothetical protein